MSRIERLAWLVMAAMISTGVTAVSSQEKADPLPAVKEMIYSWGKDNQSWLDMGYPYTKIGKVEVAPGEPYPAAIYGRRANYYAHTIDLRFQLEKPLDLVLVIDFYSQEGGEESTEELKVLLNGQLLQMVDLKPELKKKDKRYEVIDLAAEEGENIVTLDMSHNPNWYNCWFDSILLYEPLLGEEAEERESQSSGEDVKLAPD